MTLRPTHTEFYEGQIAFWEDRPENSNPYWQPGDESKLKENWSKQAQDWDDGWADAHQQDIVLVRQAISQGRSPRSDLPCDEITEELFV